MPLGAAHTPGQIITAADINAIETAVNGRGVFVDHGSTAGTARPSSSVPVKWFGTVAPTNAITNDEWYDRANEILKRYTGSAWVSAGSATYLSVTERAIDLVAHHGAKFDGITDDHAAWQASITANEALTEKVSIIGPAAESLVNSSLLITERGHRFALEGKEGRPDVGAGSCVTFGGTGALFELGTDNGHAWDAAEYDGPGDIAFRNMYLRPATSIKTTALDNAYANYAAGRYAIRAWRGGNITLEDVWMQGWDYGFWGIQSDLNEWKHVTVSECHRGAYIGPRSDQFTCETYYDNNCDVPLIIDSAHGARVPYLQTVGGGTATHGAIILAGTFARGIRKATFDAPWFEHFTGQGAAVTEAFVQINPHLQLGGATDFADGYLTAGVVIDNPYIAGSAQGTAGGYTKYLAEIGSNVGHVLVRNAHGPTALPTLLAKYFHFTGASAGQVMYESHLDLAATWDNAGSGSPDVHQRLYGYGSQRLIAGGKAFQFFTDNTATDAEFNPAVETMTWRFPNDGTGNTVHVRHSTRFTSMTAPPTSGTWRLGDFGRNETPSELGSAASKYVILGWVCTAGGTPGTWLPCRVLTGN